MAVSPSRRSKGCSIWFINGVYSSARPNFGSGPIGYIARANLPIAIAMTWVTNPVTFVPINYGIYKVGQWLPRDTTPYYPLTEFYWQGASLSETCQHLWYWLNSIGKAFLVGSMAVVIVSAMAGYIPVQSVWQLVKLMRHRQ